MSDHLMVNHNWATYLVRLSCALAIESGTGITHHQISSFSVYVLLFSVALPPLATQQYLSRATNLSNQIINLNLGDGVGVINVANELNRLSTPAASLYQLEVPTTNLRPSPRFLLDANRRFSFFPREKLGEIYQKLTNPVSADLRGFDLWGSIGYGKTYILAAVAVLLQRQFHAEAANSFVIYFNCDDLLKNKYDFLRQAIALGYAREPRLQRDSANCQDWTQICDWLVNRQAAGDQVYVIIDQFNSVYEQPGDPEAEKQKRYALREELVGLTETLLSNGAHWVRASSAHLTAAAANLKPDAAHLVTKWYGGFSDGEYGFFSGLHANDLPHMSAVDELEHLEFATGRVPLFLRIVHDAKAALVASGVAVPSFGAVWDRVLKHGEVVRIYNNIERLYLAEYQKAADSITKENIRNTYMAAVGSRFTLHAQKESMDHRYLYEEDVNGLLVLKCLNGFVADAILLVITQVTSYDVILKSQPLLDAYSDANSPAALRGWLGEKLCISSIAHFGLQLPGRINPPPQIFCDYKTTFSDQVGENDHLAHFSSLYVPRISNFPHVDLIVRMIPSSVEHGQRGTKEPGKFLSKYEPLYHFDRAHAPALTPPSAARNSVAAVKNALLQTAKGIASAIVIGIQITIAANGHLSHPRAKRGFLRSAIASNTFNRGLAAAQIGSVHYHFHWIVKRATLPANTWQNHAATGTLPQHVETWSAIEDIMDSLQGH